MNAPKILIVIVIFLLVLTACSPSKNSASEPEKEPTVNTISTSDVNTNFTPQANGDNVPDKTISPVISSTSVAEPQPDLTRSDDQGAVVVEVKPINLENPGETLNFDIVLDTHSVDLSMDLVQLSRLTTDTGKTVQAVQWDGPRGGHHVEGILSFPRSVDGNEIFEGVRSITITIKNVDVPLRTFTWQIQE